MADYYYDYTCMETLQGLSASELSSADGRKWRTIYSDPNNTKREGLDSTVWPEAFERMEQFIQDTGLNQDETRRKKAMRVLNTMLSEDAQNRIISDGQDLLSYSQDVDLHFTEYLKDVKPVIEENHM